MSAAEKRLIRSFRSLPARDRAQVMSIRRTIEQGARAEDVEFHL